MSAAVKETETKVCKNPDCPNGPGPQPVSNFYVTKNENGTSWYQPRCKTCHNAKSRENAKRRKAERKADLAKPEPIKATVPAPEPSRPCQHVWMCGDDYIRRTLPSFFDTHAPAARGYEWQVCRECGAAKEVLVYDASEYADKDDPLPAREEFRPALTVAVGKGPAQETARVQSVTATDFTVELFTAKKANWIIEVLPEPEAEPEPEQPRVDEEPEPEHFAAVLSKRIEQLERERDAWREKAAALARENLNLRARLDLLEAEADLARLDRQRQTLQEEIARLRAILKGHGERVTEEVSA